jgi:hypothetical protein
MPSNKLSGDYDPKGGRSLFLLNIHPAKNNAIG